MLPKCLHIVSTLGGYSELTLKKRSVIQVSEKLMLPREWTRKTQAPVWKAAAIAGWAFSLILAQCLVFVLAWPVLTRPPAPPPPPEAPAPAPPPAAHSYSEIQLANSLARVRCLVNVGRSQEALEEIIGCLTLCQRAQIDPPGELPALFARTVASLSRHDSPAARPAVKPGRSVAAASAAQNPLRPEEGTRLCGRMPGPGYPLAHPKARALAQLPESPLPAPPPPQVAPPTEGRTDLDRPAPYQFQPAHTQGRPPLPPGFPPPPAFDSSGPQQPPGW